MILETNISNKPLTFLLDTQADISLVKLSSIYENINLNKFDVINIKGITPDQISTHGSIFTNIYSQNYKLSTLLHVVPDEFDIPVDGILGKNFIKYYNCNIDFSNMIITVKLNNHKSIEIPLLNTPSKEWVTLPARSEVIKKITVTTENNYIFVPNQEVSRGVYVCKTIISKNSPIVRVLNTNSDNVMIKNVKIITENLEDYDIYVVEPQKENQRTGKVLEVLRKNFPKFLKHNVREKLENLCNEFSDIFALESEDITANNFYEQKLQLTDNIPVYTKNYRIPNSQKHEIKKHVQKLIDSNIVEPSTSPYNSPILLVPKKSLPNETVKRNRLVIDYRNINKKLIPDRYPIPRIDEILDNLGKAKYFSCLDLTSGFHQIPLHKESRDITSFSTDDGQYRFKRLPFGFKISPNSFQRMMNFAFSGLKPNKAFTYMDDLITIASSENQMLENLKEVFQTCRDRNLKLNPEKCSFFHHEVTFLGHKCTNQGLLPDDSKFSVILNYPRPHDADSARRFIAFCNYYRKFVNHFLLITHPILLD